MCERGEGGGGEEGKLLIWLSFLKQNRSKTKIDPNKCQLKITAVALTATTMSAMTAATTAIVTAAR